MPTLTIACPACGVRRQCEDAELGQRLQCRCGMSFAASPVFAVPDEKPNAGLGRLSGWAVGGSVALVVGFAAAATWLMTRPSAAPPPETAVATAPAEPPATTVPRSNTPAPTPTPTTNPPAGNPVTPAVPSPSPAPTPTPKPPAPPPPAETKPSPPPPPPPPPAPAETLSAIKLWDAYDLDPAAAAAKYGGKVVEVTARGRMGRDSFGRAYFGAEVVKPRGRTTGRLTPEERRWEADGYPANVRCYLTSAQAAALAGVPADRDVVLRGTCAGRKDRQDVYRGYIVELDDCVVVAGDK